MMMMMMMMMTVVKKKETVEYRPSFIDSFRLIPGKLSDLIDNLSGIHDEECEKCMARKKIGSECKFVGYKNNRLN